MNTEDVRADADQPCSIFRQELDLCQALAILQVGRLTFLDMQSYLHCFLLSRFAGILLTERSLELSRDREVPIRTRREAKLAERFLDGRVPVASTLSHRSNPQFRAIPGWQRGCPWQGRRRRHCRGRRRRSRWRVQARNSCRRCQAPAAPHRCGVSSRRSMRSRYRQGTGTDGMHGFSGDRSSFDGYAEWMTATPRQFRCRHPHRLL